ncbi:MAG: ubiquinol-cytochrome c reductase iron-sulfur subunit [Candidatus Obscuribacterales bacterium]|nr:ubiquinol-cytochrome c reductase iron-sulfur subunit [Steroidobacteraceae bacterium]
MSAEAENVDTGRRHFLVVATTTVGLVGVGATAVPFLASWRPSARARALGAPVEVDISKLEPGALLKIEWRGQAVYVVHRTAEMLATLAKLDGNLRDPQSLQSEQPAYAKNPARALKEEILVLIGVCTHLGCAPIEKFQLADAELGADWTGGFYCPCHGSKFDLAGRVFKGVPALSNLKVPPYRFISNDKLTIGADSGEA